MFVLDASVVLKWFLQEEGTEAALKIRNDYLLGKYNIMAPDLILYETANALRYSKQFTVSTAYSAIEALLDLDVDIIIPTTSLIRSAIRFAFIKKITFYDASYLALAEATQHQLITADEKLYNKVKDLNFVKLLSKFNEI